MNFSTSDHEIFEERSNVLTAKLDLDGKFITFGKNWSKCLGLTINELPGKSLFDFILNRDKEILKDAINFSLKSSQSLIFELRIIGYQNRLFPVGCEIFSKDSIIYLRCLDSTRTNLRNSAMTDVSSKTKIGAWYYDPIINKTTWSKACYNMLEISLRSKINSDSFIKFFSNEDQEILRLKSHELYTHFIPYEFLGRATLKNGKTKWIKTISKPLTHENKLVFITGTYIDVTDEVTLNEQIKSKNRILKLALKGIRSGLFYHDLKTDIVSYSSEFKRMIGISASKKQTLKLDFRESIAEEDKTPALKRHQEQLEKKSNYYENHYRLVHNDGSIQHYEVHAWKQRDAEGNLTEMVGNLINVEKQFKAEELIKTHIDRLETIIENAFMYTIILDTDRKILNADRRFANLIEKEFGVNVKKEESYFEDVIPANFRDPFLIEFSNVLKGKSVVKELETVLFSGKSTWVGVEYKPLFDEDGVVINVVMYFIDLSEKKKAELVYERAQYKFDQIELLKRKILIGLSDDIRTPINEIEKSIQLLNKITVPDNIKEACNLLHESTSKIVDTINKITNLNSLNYENNSYPEEVLDLKEAVTNSFEKLVHMANKKDLVMTIALNDDQLLVKVNSKMLSIVLDNLINNAIKNTDEGHVSIKIKKEEHSDLVNVTVSDSGRGIPTENLDKIFMDFEQANFGLEKTYEGTGIGLSICRRYLKSIGGNLTVYSQEFKGSNFVVTLPLV